MVEEEREQRGERREQGEEKREQGEEKREQERGTFGAGWNEARDHD
jgi:hypothetical protein